MRIDDENDAGEPTYEVWEGNRRVCAIMLLNDPNRAPAKWRKRFEDLATKIEPIQTVDGRVFDDPDELHFWMRNIHNGAQGGRGRKEWGPDEQHRDNPTKKNAIAFDLLERALSAGLITREQRVGTLTTLQRYVGSRHMRPVLGADDTDPSSVTYDRSPAELKKLLEVLIRDLKAGKITSRHSEEVIEKYALNLDKAAGLTASHPGVPPGDQGEAALGSGPQPYGGGGGRALAPAEPPIDGDGGAAPGSSSHEEEPSSPTKPKSPVKVRFDRGFSEAIEACGNLKLASLYFSICKVSAKDHVPLIAVGCWALLETLAHHLGSPEEKGFLHFFSTNYLQNTLGYGRREAQTILDAIGRLSRGETPQSITQRARRSITSN